MSDVENYGSTQSDAESRRFETFSYLTPMDADRIRAQVKYIISKGWNPAIEHVEPEGAFQNYWYMWKLPLFGEDDVDKILAEAEACKQAFPHNHIRLVGFDNFAQSRGAEMVIKRGNPV